MQIGFSAISTWDADINCYYIINLQLRSQQILGYIMFLTNPSYYGQSKDPYIDHWITPPSFILWCTHSGICCRCRCLCLNGTRWYPISDALGCMHVTLVTSVTLVTRLVNHVNFIHLIDGQKERTRELLRKVYKRWWVLVRNRPVSWTPSLVPVCLTSVCYLRLFTTDYPSSQCNVIEVY